MGELMARNILKAGHELTVYNRTASKMAPLAALGARPIVGAHMLRNKRHSCQ